MAVALVTGAAAPGGIGRAVALRLAHDGHDVVCLDLAAGPDGAGGSGFAHPNDLESLVKEISSLGRRALAVPGDVSDEAAVEAAVTQATD